jgi:hypothetical protein
MLFVGNGFGDVINGVYVMGMFLENFVQQGFGSWGEMLEDRFGGGCRRGNNFRFRYSNKGRIIGSVVSIWIGFRTVEKALDVMVIIADFNLGI